MRSSKRGVRARRKAESKMVQRGFRCWFAIALASIGIAAHANDYELEGTAFIGEAPTPEIQARGRNQIAAAEAYAACLTKASSSWFVKPDFTVCDSARAAYAAFLGADIADDAVGDEYAR
jgi:hypothetical protein